MKRKKDTPNVAPMLITVATAAVGSGMMVLIGMFPVLDFILKRLSKGR